MKEEVSTRTLEDSGGDVHRAGDSAILSRREMNRTLLRMGAGALAATIGTTLSGRSASGLQHLARGPRTKRRYGMVIDVLRCVGCRSCVAACKMENKTPPGVAYNKVTENQLGKMRHDRPVFLTQPCFHCEKPPCVPVCPVKPKPATYKRAEDGIVVVDYDLCIGCQACIEACPYGARSFDEGNNYLVFESNEQYARVPSPEYDQYRPRIEDEPPIYKARKCTFCLHLQDENGNYSKKEGRWPACAKTCTGHAIHFGDLNDPDSEVWRLLKSNRKRVRLRESLGLEPNVYYLL